jgi:hypothetical protein
MDPSPYRNPCPPREPTPAPDASPAIVVLVMVAAVAIVLLSHPKPAASPTVFGIIDVPVHVGRMHVGMRGVAR